MAVLSFYNVNSYIQKDGLYIEMALDWGKWPPRQYCSPINTQLIHTHCHHDGIIKWKHCPHYWPFVWGIHRSPVNSPHKGLWCGAVMFSLICAWINGRANNREAGDLRRHRTHYDVTVICTAMSLFDPADALLHLSLDSQYAVIIVWTHRGLVMPYGDIDLGQHWPR